MNSPTPTPDKPRKTAVPPGLVLGVGIGVAIGAATGNIGLWLPIGIGIGIALGAASSRKRGV